MSEASAPGPNAQPKKQSQKERIEAHPFYPYATLAVTSFGAGATALWFLAKALDYEFTHAREGKVAADAVTRVQELEARLRQPQQTGGPQDAEVKRLQLQLDEARKGAQDAANAHKREVSRLEQRVEELSAKGAVPSGTQDLVLGRLASNVSLLNNATWSVPQSLVARRIAFTLDAFASYEAAGRPGRVHITLARDGKDICSLSLSTAASPGNNVGVGDKVRTCSDDVPPNQSYTYRARIVSAGLTPERVVLETVEAAQR